MPPMVAKNVLTHPMDAKRPGGLGTTSNVVLNEEPARDGDLIQAVSDHG